MVISLAQGPPGQVLHVAVPAARAGILRVEVQVGVEHAVAVRSARFHRVLIRPLTEPEAAGCTGQRLILSWAPGRLGHSSARQCRHSGSSRSVRRCWPAGPPRLASARPLADLRGRLASLRPVRWLTCGPASPPVCWRSSRSGRVRPGGGPFRRDSGQRPPLPFLAAGLPARFPAVSPSCLFPAGGCSC
jgi:hypothetical protein